MVLSEVTHALIITQKTCRRIRSKTQHTSMDPQVQLPYAALQSNKISGQLLTLYFTFRCYLLFGFPRFQMFLHLSSVSPPSTLPSLNQRFYIIFMLASCESSGFGPRAKEDRMPGCRASRKFFLVSSHCSSAHLHTSSTNIDQYQYKY